MHKLEVHIRKNPEDPLDRKYTLTHSDETGMRFLFIDEKFAEDQYCKHRDEVIAQWNIVNGAFIFKVECPLECKESKYSADERYDIYKRHIPRVLYAILGGDKDFIAGKDDLMNAKNHIFYYYRNEKYIFEEIGTVKEYL